jgi:hypothetical protein
MNYLVILDAHANELEKILSGTKSMLISEIDPACPGDQLLQPGDHLYFLRNHDDYVIRVKAIVERVQIFVNQMDENLSPVLKEFQPRLQLTEDQYNYWSARLDYDIVGLLEHPGFTPGFDCRRESNPAIDTPSDFLGG